MANTYSAEQKAEGIARILAGETVTGAAQAVGMERTALQHELRRKRDAVTAVVTVEKPSLMTLIGDYLETTLRAMQDQSSRMGERAWIEAQTTPDLISAHDHLGRRVVAILDRLRPPPAHDDDA